MNSFALASLRLTGTLFTVRNKVIELTEPSLATGIKNKNFVNLHSAAGKPKAGGHLQDRSVGVGVREEKVSKLKYRG